MAPRRGFVNQFQDVAIAVVRARVGGIGVEAIDVVGEHHKHVAVHGVGLDIFGPIHRRGASNLAARRVSISTSAWL